MKQEKNKKKIVGLIILHYGRWEVTKECLDALTSLQSNNFTYKVIVVDNSGDELTQEKITSHPAVTKLLIPEQNLGFAQGNNLGIKQCQEWNCDYYLFLNNDTIPEPNFLKELLKPYTENGKNLGAVGPVIEHKVKGKTYYDYGGYIDWKKGQPRHFNETEHKLKPSLQSRDFVSGCCMLVSKDVIKKVGVFQPSYFLYLEDVELCLRIRKGGYNICLAPKAKIFHKGSLSSSELTRILYSWRNSFRLVFGYVPLKYKPTAFLFNLVFYPLLYLNWQTKRLYHRLKS